MNPEGKVFIVGGGPAGLAASIALRRKGFAVTVGDGSASPVDKACGEGLLPDTVAALRQMGVELETKEGYLLRGIRFLANGVAVSAEFAGGMGIGLRRTVLHSKMTAQAERLGVRLLWNSPVSGFSAAGVRIRGEFIPASLLIGADGSGSRLRRWAGLEAGTRKTRRYAFRNHFRLAPWSEYVEVYWADDA